MILKKIKSAFSLTELSVVVLVASAVLIGVLSIQTSSNSTNKIRVTNDRMGQIYGALKAYAGANKRLPCPALISVAKNDPSYGIEGSCAANTVVYGMVPFKALNLSATLAEDDYGNKLVYVVDSTFTVATTPSKFVDQEGAIVVKRYSSSLNTEESNAIFAVISRGRNQRGAVPALATAEINLPTDVDELENMPSASDVILVAGSNRSGTTFDDLVFFRNKKYFLADADLTKLQDSNMVGCTSGYTKVNGDCVIQCDIPSIVGVNSGKVNQGTNQTLYCNGTNFKTTNSINYDCSSSKVFTNNGGSCTCQTGYTLSGSSCVPITCTTQQIVGINWNGVTSVNYGSGVAQCSGSNFDTSKSVNYNCSESGFSVTSGECTCNSGYKVSGTNCVVAPFSCTGGSVVSGRKVHIFTASDTLSCNGGATNDFDILVVGGGGAGGRGFSNSNGSLQAGGGGGGQVVESLNNNISGISSFSIVVGAGGTPSSTPILTGAASSISGGSISIIANGGGRGGGYNGAAAAVTSPSPSGPGGGGSASSSIGSPGATGNATGGSGSQVSRYAGGGASSGSNGGSATSSVIGSGGAGVSSSVVGSPTTYGGGGGGAGANAVSGGTGGSGGGGRGARYASISAPTSYPAVSGTDGLGGGGGGGCGDQVTPGSGGSGVVIVSYPNN